MATGWIGMVNSEAKSWAAQLPQSLTKNKNTLAYFETARAWTGAAICDDSGTGAIKPFVIGRKNFLFSNTPRGAEASASIYSVVTTAKANGLNPRKYLEWLLAEIPNAADPGDLAYLDSLMPWPDSVPDEIRLKLAAAAEAAKMTDDPIIDIDPSAFSEEE